MPNAYLNWMSTNTRTKWCNDSALSATLDDAMADGAIGCTTNPPLAYEAVSNESAIYRSDIEKASALPAGDERAVELTSAVVRRVASRLRGLHDRSDGACGYVRVQVKPLDSADERAMYTMAIRFSSLGDNVMVKIPATHAGIAVLEELAAQGIPTNPTVCVSIAQVLAAAEANERGVRRAVAAGLAPAPSTAALVMGRLQDYLAHLNRERNAGVAADDLAMAVLAVTKRCHGIMAERGYRQLLMPAAFRTPWQVSELAGANVHMTIHPKIQSAIAKADAEGRIRRKEGIDNPVDMDAVARVARALPEFARAFDPDGLTTREFDAFGATAMTLDGFNETGWKRLSSL